MTTLSPAATTPVAGTVVHAAGVLAFATFMLQPVGSAVPVSSTGRGLVAGWRRDRSVPDARDIGERTTAVSSVIVVVSVTGGRLGAAKKTRRRRQRTAHGDSYGEERSCGPDSHAGVTMPPARNTWLDPYAVLACPKRIGPHRGRMAQQDPSKSRSVAGRTGDRSRAEQPADREQSKRERREHGQPTP